MKTSVPPPQKKAENMFLWLCISLMDYTYYSINFQAGLLPFICHFAILQRVCVEFRQIKDQNEGKRADEGDEYSILQGMESSI